MTTCNNCKRNNGDFEIWSAGWISAYRGPMAICSKCYSKYNSQQYIIQGQDAWHQYTQCEFVRNFDENFEEMKEKIRTEGELLKGSNEWIGLFSRVLFKYNGDYWIVMKYALTNLKKNDFWINKLEWR